MAEHSFVGLVDAAVRVAGDRPAIHYFDHVLDYARLDRESDALAVALQHGGLATGDRLMVCLQNVPAFVIAFLAAAKIGVITVPVNPMYRQREIAGLVADCTPAAIIAHGDLFSEVLPVVPGVPPLRYVVQPRDRQTANPDWLPADVRVPDDVRALETVIAANLGRRPARAEDDPLLLVYTSGTTGKPKGAMLSHRNLIAGATFYRDAARLSGSGGVLAAAPLFHVTGLSGHIGAAIASATPLSLCYRFSPAIVLQAIERSRPSFIVASITAFSALIDDPQFDRARIASVETAFSGGAPIPPALQRRIFAATGLEVRNVYGLTETTAPVLAVPAGAAAPVDRVSGALSVGRPVPGTQVTILAEDGTAAGDGETGEVVVIGPTVSAGYWRNPEATAESMRADGFRTGDVGMRDADGWFYLVDRKKDMIIASGFKVWPREVEDVLYTHPAVREAAVVGIPDAYRGETVKAVVSLNRGVVVQTDELIAYCKARMAAYKYPRVVEIVSELPKNAAGKILRRALRPG